MSLTVFKDYLTMWMVLPLRCVFIHTMLRCVFIHRILERKRKGEMRHTDLKSVFHNVKEWRHKYIIQSNLMISMWSNQSWSRSWSRNTAGVRILPLDPPPPGRLPSPSPYPHKPLSAIWLAPRDTQSSQERVGILASLGHKGRGIGCL